MKLKSAFVIALLATTFSTYAANFSAVQDIQTNFKEFLGKYDLVECKSVAVIPSGATTTSTCENPKAEIYLAKGYEAVPPYDSVVLSMETPGNLRSWKGVTIAEIGGGANDVCYTTPGYQYCDITVERPAKTDGNEITHFIMTTKVEKVGDYVIVNATLNLPNQNSDFLHRSYTLKLKKIE